MLSTPAPVFIDRGLDRNDVVSGDGPFSDSNGRHSHYITEKGLGRQTKVKKNEKKFKAFSIRIPIFRDPKIEAPFFAPLAAFAFDSASIRAVLPFGLSCP